MKYYKDELKSSTNKYPCDYCEVGSGCYSQGKDEKGEYIEIISCKDTCKKYKEYLNKLNVCEFCGNGKDNKPIRTNTWWNLGIFNNYLYAKFEDGDSSFSNIVTEINYCPKCGKKL